MLAPALSGEGGAWVLAGEMLSTRSERLPGDDIHMFASRVCLLKERTGTVVDCTKPLVLAIGDCDTVRESHWCGEQIDFILGSCCVRVV